MMISVMAAMVLAAGPISMEFDGSLKDGLKQLAQKSGLNLVVIGEFDEHVNLNLPAVNGEEALETIAEAYGLQVTRSGKAADGKMWVIRRATGGVAVTALTPGLSAEDARELADRAREAADRARAQVDTVKEKTEAAREASQDAREQAQEAAESTREQAREAAETAREQAQEAAEAERERGILRPGSSR